MDALTACSSDLSSNASSSRRSSAKRRTGTRMPGRYEVGSSQRKGDSFLKSCLRTWRRSDIENDRGEQSLRALFDLQFVVGDGLDWLGQTCERHFPERGSQTPVPSDRESDVLEGDA